MARKTLHAARAAHLTDKLLSGHMLTDDERCELRTLTAAATAEAEMPAAVRALERAQAKVEARVQDFSSYRPRPRPGTIEVWLP